MDVVVGVMGEKARGRGVVGAIGEEDRVKSDQALT